MPQVGATESLIEDGKIQKETYDRELTLEVFGEGESNGPLDWKLATSYDIRMPKVTLSMGYLGKPKLNTLISREEREISIQCGFFFGATISESIPLVSRESGKRPA